MSIDIHSLVYLDQHPVCQSTYSMSIDIHGMYVNQDILCRFTCQSRYCISISCCAQLLTFQSTRQPLYKLDSLQLDFDYTVVQY